MITTTKHPQKKSQPCGYQGLANVSRHFSGRNGSNGENLEAQITNLETQTQNLHESQGKIEQKARYYLSLFDSAPMGYVILDSEGIIHEVNQAATSILSAPRNVLLHMEFSQFLTKESIPSFFKHLRVCKNTQKQENIELTLRTHDKRSLPVELIINSTRSPNGTTLFQCVIMDVSERRFTEHALQKSQDNYLNLVNAIDGIVWEAEGQTGNFTFISNQAQRLLGYPAERWLHDPDFFINHIHPDDREQVVNARLKNVAALKNYVQEFRIYTSRKKIVWMRNNVSVMKNSGGRVHLHGVMVNITGLKEAEEALREETRALETLNRIGTTLTAELNVEKLVRAVTEAGKDITGAKFGAFAYKHLGDHSSKFILHTTAGTPRKVFAHLPLPQHDPSIPSTQAESEIICIDDLLHGADSRLKKSNRQTSHETYAVRSYLAVPVISRSGEVLGGLLFGHPSPGMFSERSQHLLAGIAAEAGIALDNAHLYQAVKESEAHFRELADAMPQIVWTADRHGRIDYYNQRWYQFTGQREKVPTHNHGESWIPYLHPEDCSHCTGKWRETVQLQKAFQVECRLKAQNGAYRWFLIRSIPIRDETGGITRWFGTFTDIDDQKQAEEKVRVLNTALEKRVLERTAQLQVSNQELEAFSYSVSHDLRAPLRSINAFSELVREDYGDKLDDQGRHYLSIVKDASAQMGRLIDDLLYLSRVTRGQIRRQPINLSSIAHGILADLRRMEPHRKVETHISPRLEVSADERLVRIALENLLSNAWKFTGKVPHAHIEVGMKLEQEKAIYFVRDNGAGFDMTYADRLFSAFQRLHSNSDFPGHGIGLATVQRIITRHGGRIWAESAPNQGATFFFTLPAAS